MIATLTTARELYLNTCRVVVTAKGSTPDSYYPTWKTYPSAWKFAQETGADVHAVIEALDRGGIWPIDDESQLELDEEKGPWEAPGGALLPHHTERMKFHLPQAINEIREVLYSDGTSNFIVVGPQSKLCYGVTKYYTGTREAAEAYLAGTWKPSEL